MIKGILASAIIILCGAMGLIYSHRYSQRVRDLDSLLNILQQLGAEICYRKDPLQVIFNHIKSENNSAANNIINKCSMYLDGNTEFEKCWERAVKETCKESCLTDNDGLILIDTGSQLGKSSSQDQMNIIRLAEEKIRHQIKDAEHEKNSKGKMYGGLGFSTGIVIAVLLI